MVVFNDDPQMVQRVVEIGEESAELKRTFFHENAERVVQAAQAIAKAFQDGNRLFLFGNGGSAADAQHIAAEFVNRFVMERPGLPAMALTTDCSVITSIGNDYDFKDIFSRQIKALAMPGDVAWGISTSGSSPNVVQGLNAARTLGMTRIALTGGKGTQAALLSDIALEVEHSETARIQEVHIVVGHAVCELVDSILFRYSK